MPAHYWLKIRHHWNDFKNEGMFPRDCKAICVCLGVILTIDKGCAIAVRNFWRSIWYHHTENGLKPETIDEEMVRQFIESPHIYNMNPKSGMKEVISIAAPQTDWCNRSQEGQA